MQKMDKEKKRLNSTPGRFEPLLTGPEANTLPTDPLYFVVNIRRLGEIDIQKSVTTDSSSSGSST